MATKLSVPMVTQQRNMSCWYASACMVAYYHQAGPRLGLPKKWHDNHGIKLADFASLAAAEGLEAIKTPTGTITEQMLDIWLKNMGPIWCAGFWDGFGHIVVLTGVEGGKVFINDPNPAVKEREETIAWFNEKSAAPAANVFMYHKA